jgi:hypothetical protein
MEIPKIPLRVVVLVLSVLLNLFFILSTLESQTHIRIFTQILHRNPPPQATVKVLSPLRPLPPLPFIDQDGRISNSPLSTGKRTDNSQLPSLLFCCLHQFLQNCNWDFACAISQYLHSANVYNNISSGQLDSCILDEQRAHNLDGLKVEAGFSAALQFAKDHATPVNHTQQALPRVWMTVSVKDDARYLLYHILHHAALGVEHFIVYDEGDGALRSLLSPLGDYVSYEIVPHKSQLKSQLKSLIAARDAKVDFLGQLDCDEFVYLPNVLSLPVYLSQFDQHVGSVSFQWNMQSSGTTFPANASSGSLSALVKSFHRPSGVDTKVLYNPHTKRLLPGFWQELAGNHFVMSNGPEGHDVVAAGHNIDSAVHPFILHFRTRTLHDFIRKTYRGTGGKLRKTDFMPLEQTVSMWHGWHHSGSKNRTIATPLSPAFINMVQGFMGVLFRHTQ